jgi:hypothetical protein
MLTSRSKVCAKKTWYTSCYTSPAEPEQRGATPCNAIGGSQTTYSRRRCIALHGVAEKWTHNPLVLGSNPSGPTNQPIDDAVVRKIGANDCRRLTGRLKLFSQLFETEISASGIVRAQIDGSHRHKSGAAVFQISKSILAGPTSRQARGVVESRAALADPGGEIGILI